MATGQIPGESPAEQRFLLRAVDWPTYQTISKALTGRHVRLTYDQGNLEFTTISYARGNCSRLIGHFIAVLTEESNLPLHGNGDMTCDREDLDRGVEPDESFYIVNEPLIRGKTEIDLTIDPPPDLILEVDISRDSRSRLGIYAALRVPEVWRFDGQTLFVHRLGADGNYALADRSRYFPQVPLEDLVAFIHRRTEMDENSLIREFRAWLRQQIARGWQAPS